MIEQEAPEMPLSVQADLLGISRSSLYYRRQMPSAQEVALKHKIDEIYTRWPFYGSRRMAIALQRGGLSVSRPTVQRYMREMGLAGVAPGPNTSQPGPEHTIHPYLLRHVTAEYPNHIWGVDVTYIRLEGGWMYLVAILDWFSRFVVAWELDETLALPFVLRAVDRALVQARPVIVNSDQGSHFTSLPYLERMLAAGVRISMDGRGRAMDNIFTERLWRSVKYEEVYLNEYASPREAQQSLSRYFQFYNHERPHQSLGYCTPAELYGLQDQVLVFPTLREEYN